MRRVALEHDGEAVPPELDLTAGEQAAAEQSYADLREQCAASGIDLDAEIVAGEARRDEHAREGVSEPL